MASDKQVQADPAVPRPAAVFAPDAFVLEPPRALAPVAIASVSGRFGPKADEIGALDARVRQFIDDVTAAHPAEPSMQEAAERVRALGNKESEASAFVSQRMLERPLRSMKNGLFDDGSDVGRGLIDLRRAIEELDPSRQGDLLAPRKLLGIIPLGNRLADYFERYAASQRRLNQIVESLRRGKDELIRDNATIEQEKSNLSILMERLEKCIYIGKRLDGELAGKIDEIEASDAEKARIVRQEILFVVRQKQTDLLTQLSVNGQAYQALDIVRANNIELIKGVDRATTTTLTALRTAVVVARALTNQKLVLDQITALNAATYGMIEAASEIARDEGPKVHRQAASATIEIERLRRAFENVYRTMDAIAEYKARALDTMRTTVNCLADEAVKARSCLERVGRGEASQTAASGISDGEVTI